MQLHKIKEYHARSIIVRCIKKILPMKYSTPDDELSRSQLSTLKPSETTLQIIRHIAHTYRIMNINGKHENYCFN